MTANFVRLVFKKSARYKLDINVRYEKQAINCCCYYYYYYIIIMTDVAEVKHCRVGKCRQFDSTNCIADCSL